MHAKLDYVFEFLSDLERNNTRAWMHTRANERRFDVVQRTMQQWVAMLLLDMQGIEDTRGLKAKDCMYRIWRDTRFGSDKTPCKTYLSFIIRKGGRRNENRSAYYLQIGPGGQSFVAGGVYRPDSPRIKKIRSAIVKDGGSLQKIITTKSFIKSFGELESLKLKTMPRDFKGEGMSSAQRELLRHTSWIVRCSLSDRVVLSQEFDESLVKIFASMKPFNDWLNFALGS